MKKHITLLGATLCASAVAFGQTTFSDDFESYSAGDYIGANNPTWTTWSGTTGGAEDAQVVTNQASSGTNAIYFEATSANGGPQDVILPFGGPHDLGTFTFESDFYVTSGQGAYFNFQADNTPGTTWALSCYMLETGVMNLDDGANVVASASFPHATWFNLRVDINLNTNTWELFIDNVSQGSWANDVNRVASADLFPVNPTTAGGNGLSAYWMDDVAYSHTAYTLPATNLGAINLGVAGGLAGQNVMPVVDVRNLGTGAITSFDVEIDYNGNQYSESVSGINLASLAFYTHNMTTAIPLVAGNNAMTVTISNVNGAGQDDDAADDSKSINLDPVVPAAGKVVLGEEATGTWCGWCPRGSDWMEYMADTYDGFWAGVAVHNGDPMVETNYDAGIGSLIGGYPSSLVDRGGDIDPSAMEPAFLTNVVMAPSAVFTNGATWDANTRELNVSLSTDWDVNASGNWKIACVLTEDGVTGTSSQYAQTNYYSFQSQNLADPLPGTGLDWQAENNPVPAASMVYDHVARAISPDFAGMNNAFPASINSGETHVHNFSFTLPADWDENNIHIVGILINPSGAVDNAGTSSIAEAVANGFVTGVEGPDANLFNGPDDAVKVFPNPAQDQAFIDLNLQDNSNVNVRVISITGQVIMDRNYGTMSGTYRLPLNTAEMAQGMYMIEVRLGDQVTTKQLIVK